MTPPIDPKEVHRLIVLYLDDSLSEQDRERFERWVRQSPEHPKQVAELAATDYALHEVCRETKADYLLPILKLIDNDAGPSQPVELIHLSNSDNWWQKRSVIVASLSVAASLAIAITLILVFSGGGAQAPTGGIAGAQDGTAEVPANDRAVAVLTAQRDATWRTPGRAIGDDLYAAQRIELTQGFAEVTTQSGAIVILEAPTAVQLTNNANAIRLHAGKLVGICETESSKGFVVRTPHINVTDLGTRFGVDASDPDVTRVHVLEGEVQATSNSSAFSTVRLRAGESARGSSVASQLVRIAFDPSLFDARALGAVAHLGTGQNLAAGTADPGWRIAVIDGKPLDQPVKVHVADPSKFTNTIRENLRFMPNVPGRSQWITPPDSIDFESIQDTVTYQTQFDTTGVDLSALEATLRFVADNQIKSIELNGQMLRVPPHATDMDYTHMTAISLQQGLVQGENTLTFTVRRYRTKTANDYWTGLRAELELIDPRLRVGPNE